MNIEKYFSFYGSATRSEYWGVQIISYIVFFVFAMVAALISTALGPSGVIAVGVFIFLLIVPLTWIVMATTARRCRDAGINPWFTAAIFIPYLAIIPWIVFGCLSTVKGEQNGNKEKSNTSVN
jgi:uncharacterized membrane protein YhaH (DUF805 family)